MRTPTKRWMAPAHALMAGLVAAALFTPCSAGDDRLVVFVPEPFSVDGQLFPAGVLSVRHLRHYNPTTTLDEISVGAECLGIRMAQRHRTEGATDFDAVVFRRNAHGRLALSGYVLRGDSPGEIFTFADAEHAEDSPDFSPVVLASARR